MTAKLVLENASFAQLILCVGLLLLFIKKGLAHTRSWLLALIVTCALDGLLTIPLLFFRKALHIGIDPAYRTYVYGHWFFYLAQSFLIFATIFAVFSDAMEPFPALQRGGRVVFRWFGAVALLVAVGVALVPQIASRSAPTLTAAITSGSAALQEGLSILVLCLLLFVCFATRTLGLTYRSYSFGVCLGLGVHALERLVQAAWFPTAGAHSVYSAVYAASTVGFCVTLLIWGVYFALPEPERGLILLPTTSPFFHWNSIAEELGDAPGHVAVAGFTPDMLAPGEIQMMTAASVASTRRKREWLEAQAAKALPLDAAVADAASAQV